jgi:DNA-binding PadR family transcriptional regulator
VAPVKRTRVESKGHLDLLVLAVLARGPVHGYALIGALRDTSQGVFEMPEGTIYPALHRLEEEGLVASEWVVARGRRRRVYSLSPAGEVELARQRQEWAQLSEGVNAVLGWTV